jgi:hypothetical protein
VPGEVTVLILAQFVHMVVELEDPFAVVVVVEAAEVVLVKVM